MRVHVFSGGSITLTLWGLVIKDSCAISAKIAFSSKNFTKAFSGALGEPIVMPKFVDNFTCLMLRPVKHHLPMHAKLC